MPTVIWRSTGMLMISFGAELSTLGYVVGSMGLSASEVAMRDASAKVQCYD